MLKTGQLRIKILLLATMIFLVALSGCVPKKNIYAILLEYYEAYRTKLPAALFAYNYKLENLTKILTSNVA